MGADIANSFNSNTKIIGVIGHPIKHSFSPFMHNLAFELGNLNYKFLPFNVPGENLKAALKGVVALGIKGLSVTLPHKERIIEYCDVISDEASIVGAVNTIVNENGKLHGFNTDVNGILETLLPIKDSISDKEVTVIGAGGAARSVIYTLIRHFKTGKINIINRTGQKAESLKEYFSAKMLYDSFDTYELVPPDLIGVFSRSKLIINTTSIGMEPEIDDTPTSITDSFNENHVLFDVIYNPLTTKFLTIAQSQGAEILNGLKMFVEQGARSFELWTGEQMPKLKIYDALYSQLSK